jgi:hypothetical protein
MCERLTLPVLLLALSLPLCAQWPGENLVGVQGRANIPAGDLPDAVASEAPGLGASVQAELHLAPYRLERNQCRICARVGLGADVWRKPGGSSGRSVTAFHAGADVLYFLRDDGREWLNGPYLIGGLQAMEWVVGTAASDTGSLERTFRAGYAGGFGERLNPHLDAEFKILVSEVDPALKVGVVTVALDCWF